MAHRRSSSGRGGRKAWRVVVDAALCSLCEGCVRHCPTGALAASRQGATLRLTFRPSRCDGCVGREGCETICPEHAVSRRASPARAPAGADEEVLVEGELRACTHCHAYFASDRKLVAVARRSDGQELIADLCPLCRREQLVVHFIEKHRAPGSSAEYRSAKEILRRAGYATGRRKAPG